MSLHIYRKHLGKIQIVGTLNENGAFSYEFPIV